MECAVIRTLVLLLATLCSWTVAHSEPLALKDTGVYVYDVSSGLDPVTANSGFLPAESMYEILETLNRPNNNKAFKINVTGTSVKKYMSKMYWIFESNTETSEATSISTCSGCFNTSSEAASPLSKSNTTALVQVVANVDRFFPATNLNRAPASVLKKATIPAKSNAGP